MDQQDKLQAEADLVVQQLGLGEALGRFGRPVRVGSSAMGLMVRHDIDITVIVPKLDATVLAAMTGLASELMQRTDTVMSVRFRNDAGAWNAEPDKYPDGLYLGLTVRTAETWTLDIWVIDQPERQPDLAHLETLLPRLTDEHRAKILAIKRVLAARPPAPPNIPSALVYEAVVDHGISTVEAFEAWRERRASRPANP